MVAIKEIYLWTTKVRPEKWKPWANTVLYCPLEDDILDHSWNHTMSLTNTTYWTVAKDSTWFYMFSWGYISSESYAWPTSAATLSVWVKRLTKTTWDPSRERWLDTHYRGSSPYHCWLALDACWQYGTWVTSWTVENTMTAIPIGTWTLFTLTYDSSSWAKVYKNATLERSNSNTSGLRNLSLPTFIWATNPYGNQFIYGYMSDVIIEDKAWTATEISDYYNLTKWNYWL